MVVRWKSCISPMTTVWWSDGNRTFRLSRIVAHGGQMEIVHFVCHDSMVVRWKSCISPVTTIAHGGQMEIVHFASHDSMVVRWKSCISPVTTVWWSDGNRAFRQSRLYGDQMEIVHFASHDTSTCWSDGKLELSAERSVHHGWHRHCLATTKRMVADNGALHGNVPLHRHMKNK